MCLQYVSIFVGVVSLFELRILEIQFSALFSYILFTYWPEILYMTFCLWTSDQVRVSSICVIFFVGVMPVSEIRILEIYTSFCTFVPYALTYWAWILYIIFSFYGLQINWLTFLEVKFEVVMPSLDVQFCALSCFEIELQSLIQLLRFLTHHSVVSISKLL